MSWYNQNSDTQLELKLLGWNARFLVVKLAQRQWFGFSGGQTRSNGRVPGWNWTRNRTGNLELLSTLLPSGIEFNQYDSLQSPFLKVTSTQSLFLAPWMDRATIALIVTISRFEPMSESTSEQYSHDHICSNWVKYTYLSLPVHLQF